MSSASWRCFGPATLVDGEREEAPQHLLARGMLGAELLRVELGSPPAPLRIGDRLMAHSGLDASTRNPGGNTAISWS